MKAPAPSLSVDPPSGQPLLPSLDIGGDGLDVVEVCAIRHSRRMNIELSTFEERAEAEEHLAETMRILNAAIPRVHRSGLMVSAEILTMHSRDGALPQLNINTLD